MFKLDESLSAKIAKAKKSGHSVGLVQGSWDMFHLGHLCYLQEARKSCDFLIVAMDDDEKIRYRKGNNRPIIPLEERYQTIDRLGIADALVVKHLGEPHWGLIKAVKPDVLIVIKENYTDEEIVELEGICGRVAVLPRQATTSTSDIIRRTLIKNGVKSLGKKDARVKQAVKAFRERVSAHDNMPAPLPDLLETMNSSTDPVAPNAACCFWQGKWVFGANQIDQSLPESEIEHRTELFYSTIEHAEINLLKQLGNVDLSDVPVYVTLLPCDKCLKVLIDKGIRQIYYLEDHPERGWSKRSKALASEKGVTLTHLEITESAASGTSMPSEAGTPEVTTEDVGRRRPVTTGSQDVRSCSERHDVQDLHNLKSASASGCLPEISGKIPSISEFRFGDPRNAREQKQLDIMVENELASRDPFDPAEIDQPILFSMQHWFASSNRFPYDDVEHQFLIIAKDPVYRIEDVTPAMWAELKLVWDRLRRDYSLPGGALCFRFGDTLRSGASLKRLHLHLIVPKSGHKARFTIGGNPELKPGLNLDIIDRIKGESK